MNIEMKLKRALWWIRYRTTHRCHIINISGEDDYDKGWIDRDHAMYLACFKLLRDFVELEDPDIGNRTLVNYVDPSRPPSPEEIPIIQRQVDREKEIRYLYDWWTKGRPYMHKKAEKLLHDFDAWCKEQDRLDAMDDEMLDRLMKVRKHLWT